MVNYSIGHRYLVGMCAVPLADFVLHVLAEGVDVAAQNFVPVTVFPHTYHFERTAHGLSHKPPNVCARRAFTARAANYVV
jgi:hypothetical protein